MSAFILSIISGAISGIIVLFVGQLFTKNSRFPNYHLNYWFVINQLPSNIESQQTKTKNLINPVKIQRQYNRKTLKEKILEASFLVITIYGLYLSFFVPMQFKLGLFSPHEESYFNLQDTRVHYIGNYSLNEETTIFLAFLFTTGFYLPCRSVIRWSYRICENVLLEYTEIADTTKWIISVGLFTVLNTLIAGHVNFVVFPEFSYLEALIRSLSFAIILIALGFFSARK